MPHSQQIQSLINKLDTICLNKKYLLKKQLYDIAHQKSIDTEKLEKLNSQIERAHNVYLSRQQKAPKHIDFPDFLPVCEKKQQIADLIQSNQVVIISGETGSGKTTQIPKICLSLGLGVKGYIGHTQPRRLAARAVATRIAEEMSSEIGNIVGYKVRFNDHVEETTLVKLMTDGILLAEIQQDRLLHQYEVIIIDEAHERSLNIDFILGYLKQLLPNRPDLKVIITSATIDVKRLSHHFNDAPIVEVSGRTYPVEVRYRQTDTDDNDFQSIINAIDELSYEDSRGDILIFLTGEREIRDLTRQLTKLDLKNTDIIPLYARLSASEQNRIFQTHHHRRIILSTNVAETSLTVPGIKYVIDPGWVRMSRYSYRTKVQRLPIEPISQASANQRKGRCGRTSNGICIRLYDEQDFLNRPEFTDPEILRTHLASVILQMKALDLGNIAKFPFIDAPDQKQIKDGIRLLEELNVVYLKNGHYTLTKIGKVLSQLPVDPRFARMLVEAQKRSCVKEIMIITAALSIQDPRESPLNKKQSANEKHKRFMDKHSDFISYLNLWRYIKEQQDTLSNNQFRQLCKKEFINYLRIKEWQDIYTQIRQTIKQLGIPINTKEGEYTSIHTAILSGLLSHIGMKEIDKFEYLGARQIKFAIFPGSSVFKALPKWCVAGELVETSRLWGRNVAKIEPEWIEPLATHLSKKQYSEPRWSKKHGTTLANEKVKLFGLPIISNRIIYYNRIDPVISRELFIRHALIEGDFEAKYDFFIKNHQLIDDIEGLEHKARRQNILVDESILFNFYDNKIPTTVTCEKDFDSWWKAQQQNNPNYLLLTKEGLMNPNSHQVTKDDYPDIWFYNDQLQFKLTYQFKLGDVRDGVTIEIPLTVLNQIENDIPFQWQVQGFRHELIVALIKSLPKSLRRNLVPAPNYAQAFLERVEPYKIDLLTQLETEFKKMTGMTIHREDWQLDQIPDYLKLTFRVIDNKGKTLLIGKNLNHLNDKLKDNVQKVLTEVTQQKHHEIEQNNITSWSFGDLPKIYEKKQQHYTVKAYPTLIDKKNSVAIKLVNTEDEQIKLMKKGIRRLVYLNIPSPIKYLHEKLPNKAKLGLHFSSFGKITDLIDDLIYCAIDHFIIQEDPLYEEHQFQFLLEKIKGEINAKIIDIASQVEKILTLHYQINKQLKGKMDLSVALSLSDIKNQLSQLIYPGFVSDSSYQKLPDIYRYLQAIEKRIEKLYRDPNRDRLNILIIERVNKRYIELSKNRETDQIGRDNIIQLRWMIEELRVSLFAQQIKTAYPISEKRIIQFIEQLKK